MPTTDLADYGAVQDYLFSLKAQGPKFGLDRMRGVVEVLGHPEHAVPVIHIAGTNGKGSVAAMIEAIFRAAGRRTGLYTSPHLVKLGERVQVNREILSEAEIMAYTRELRPLAEQLGCFDASDRPSFFEFMTAMAFLQFARHRCDIGIVEVGLGGRLDATNVVEPEVAVITSIGLDHCDVLGDTLEKIAAEKAGIIKPGRPTVLGRMPGVAESVIRNIAAGRRSRIVSVAEIFGGDLDHCPQTNLEGDYQRWNAATAALVARTMPPSLRPSEEAIERGLQNVTWPGRWQRLRLADGRLLVLDASHNAEGAQSLEAGLKKLAAETGCAPIVVTGVLGEFRAQALLPVIGRRAQEIHLVIPQQTRACSYEELERYVPANFKGRLARAILDEIFPAPNCCTIGGPTDTIVVTGSICLVGEMLTRLEPSRGSGEGRLQDY
jgi:dihydrofolate synthase / folylpolyglutamate synthase